MKPLPTSQLMLSWISVCPVEENTSKWKKVILKIFPFVLIAGNIAGLTSSIVYFLKFISTDLEESLYALFQIVGQLNMTNAIIITFVVRHRLTAMFENLKKIYTSNPNDDSFRFLARANNQAEWTWRSYIILMVSSSSCSLILIPAASVVFCLMTKGAFDEKFVYHPFKHLLPWDQKNPYGYFYELIFDYIAAVGYLIVSGIMFILFISVCLFHPAFYKKFQYSLRKLDQPNTDRNNKDLLCEIIQFHISTKDWFLESANVYSPYILVQLISFMIFLACNVFQLDLLLRHIEFSITMLLPITIITILTLFAYCYFGKLATESFIEMSDCLYESNWSNLPLDLQKYMIIMIENAQKPLYYHGYGVAVLNLEAFTKCLKTVYTYYMLFKTITID